MQDLGIERKGVGRGRQRAGECAHASPVLVETVGTMGTVPGASCAAGWDRPATARRSRGTLCERRISSRERSGLEVQHLAPRGDHREVHILEPYDARRGTLVRVREGHWKTDFAGMLGTVQKVWAQSEHAAVDVLMEDGRLELFWLPNLDAVDGDIAV